MMGTVRRMNDWRTRLRREIEAQGLDMKGVSLKAGLGPSYIFDALTRGRGGKIDNLRKIESALGKTPGWLTTDDTNDLRAAQSVELSRPIYIVGSVEAGAWRTVTDGLPEFDQQVISPLFADRRYPIEAQFDLIVRGNSINRFARDGDLLRCVSLIKSGISLQDGQYVVVECTKDNGSLRETTVKRLEIKSGGYTLHPDSDDPRYQKPVTLPRGGDDREIQIIAVVLYQYRPAMRSAFPG